MKAVKQGNTLWVHWKGRTYSLPLSTGRASTSIDQGQDLVAPYSCKVLKVLVQSGQRLKAGDSVVIVEAMKMEYCFTSPIEGTVGKVNVEVGKVVSAGTAFIDWAKE